MTTRSEQARDTRGRILEAARARFADEGFEQATIRSIAADAQIDPAMVIRYFGSKQALFEAATDVDLGLAAITEVPGPEMGRAIAERFLDLWESPVTGPVLRTLLITAGSPAGRDRVAAVFTTQLAPAFSALGNPSRTRAAMLATQLLGFALARYILRLPPIAELDRAAALALLAPAVQWHLDTSTD